LTFTLEPMARVTLKGELQDVASELGLTREAFYRTIASLERAGAIKRSSARIVLKSSVKNSEAIEWAE